MPENTTREEGVVYLISPDGETKEPFLEGDVQTMRQQGWSVDPSQNLGVQTPYGQAYGSGELLEQSLRRGAPVGVMPTPDVEAEYQSRAAEERYGDSELAALGLGVARGLTFGGSDIIASDILGDEYVRGVREYNPIASGVGEFGSILGTTLLAPGSSLLRATPAGALSAKTAQLGAKSTKAYIAAEALEGMAYGVGQGISNLALQNEPLTAEGIASELLQDGLIGGAFGGAGGAAFKGAGALYGKLRKADPPMPDIFKSTTPEGAEFLGRTGRHIDEALTLGDDVLGRTSPTAWQRMDNSELKLYQDWSDGTRTMIGDTVGAATRKADELDTGIKELEDLWSRRPPAKPPNRTDFIEWNLPDRGHMQDVRALVDETDIANDMISDMLSHRQFEELSDAAMLARKGIQEGYESVPGGYPGVKPFDTDWEGQLGKGFGTKADDIVDENLQLLPKGEQPQDQARAAWSMLWDPVVEYRKTLNRLAGEVGAGKVVDDLPFDPSVMFRIRVDEKAYADAIKRSAPIAEPKELAQMREMAAELRKHADSLKTYGGNLKAAEDPLAAARSLGDDFTDTVVAARKLVGDSEDAIEAFANDQALIARYAEEIASRKPPKLPGDAQVARESLTRATANMRKFFGNKPDHLSMEKVLNGTPSEISEAFASLQEYRAALTTLAKASGDPKMVADAQAALKRFDDIVAESVPKEMVEKANGIAGMDLLGSIGIAETVIPGLIVPDIEGTPLDNIAKAAIAFSLIRKGKMGGKAIDAVTESAKPGRIRSAISKHGSYLSGRGLSQTVPQSTGHGWGSKFAQGVKRGAAYKLGGAAFQGMDKFLSARGLMQASSRSKSRVTQAVAALGKKAAAKSAQGGVGAVAALKALRLLDDREEASQRESESLRELYKKRAEQLRRLASNPHALAMHFHELTTPIREQHPTLGDKVEVTLTRGAQYLASTLPKDPGTSHVMGMSTWEPDMIEMYKLGERAAVFLDPTSAVYGVKDGSISHAGAEALRIIYPEIFAETQRQIAENIPQIIENTTYDEQTRLSILSGVPVSSSNSPEYVQFVMQQYAARAQQNQPQPQASGPLPSDEPTKAQQLSSRGLE